MNEVNLPAIEPVTDEDVSVAVKVGEMVVAPFVQQALEQDRRRVAQRQAERHSVGSTLRHTNVARLRELSHAVTQGPDAIRRECSMRVPAEPDRDADLVLSSAADEIERLRAEVARLTAACAQMREALRGANHRIIYGEWASDYSHSLFAAALSTDAGKGWIDATGAVEGKIAQGHLSTRQVWTAKDAITAEWAGSPVKIIRVP